MKYVKAGIILFSKHIITLDGSESENTVYSQWTERVS